MDSVWLHSEAETRALGERLGALARAGDWVVLTGQVGAGKSVLTQGIARGLGVVGPTPSPTYARMLVHEGVRWALVHADLYLVEHQRDVRALGLDEQPDAVVVVEWGERFPEELAEQYLGLELVEAAHGRELLARPRGARAAALWKACCGG